MPGFKLPATTTLGTVTLRVSDLDRAITFYRDLLGFRVSSRSAASASLGFPPGRPLLELKEHRSTGPARGEAPGLYHVALLVPSRPELARVLLRLREHNWPLQGLSDHGVSEAIYLPDPDGIGLEIYADRPVSEWGGRGEPLMVTRPLDTADLLNSIRDAAREGDTLPPSTVIGHIHLHSAGLRSAEAFYTEALGMDVMMRIPGSVSFMAAGNYHHHVAVNSWGRRSATGESRAGLEGFELLISADAADSLIAHLRARGIRAEESGKAAGAPASGAGWTVRDADGIPIYIRGVRESELPEPRPGRVVE